MNAQPQPSNRTCFVANLLGIAAIVAALPLACVYFTWEATWNDVRTQCRAFYSQVRPGWLILREQEVADALKSGNPDPWHTYIVRAALGRWRVRSAYPEPFDNLMRDYEHGAWLAPDRNAWERLFTEFDRDWLRRRVEARPDGARDEATRRMAVSSGRGRVTIRFGTPPATCSVGSVVRLFLEARPGDLPDGPPAVYWETTAAQGPAAHRRRLGLWKPGEFGETGTQRFSVTVDMSWEPAWMAPGARLSAIHLAGGQKAKSWKLLHVDFEDSPWLTP